MTTTDSPASLNDHRTPAPSPPPGVEIIDLTPEDKAELQPKWFRIGPNPDDIFCAAPSVPVQFGIDYVKAWRVRDDDDATAAEKFAALLRRVLLPGHRERWEARYTDPEHPIDHRILLRTMDRLLVEYGLRPTREPSDSSDGSPPPDDGTSTEDASPPEGSTSSESPSTEDSTSPTASPSTAST
jgi:hypothetical protein